MTKRDRWPAIFFFSLYICFESLHLGFGHWRKPGPGFFSFWSAAALGCFASIVLFHNWKSKENGEESPEQASWRGRILCLLSLLIFILLLDTLGFILTAFLFITFYLKVVERKGWKTATLSGVAIALASYGIFEICLKSQLPKGILENLGI
jgi:putative tricarboxylic transport membrane protein